MRKYNDIVFLFLLSIILIGGFVYSLFNIETINELENRSSYKYKSITKKDFLNKKFQDNVENALSDQLPFSASAKEGYNYVYSSLSKLMTSVIVGDKCEKKYVYYSDDCTVFGCNQYLAKQPLKSSDLSFRTSTIQEIIDKSGIPVYIYYIERFDDINLETDEKNGSYERFKDSLSIDDSHIRRLELKSSDDYEKYFYKTDHHLNYIGAYKVYNEIIDMLGEKKPLEYSGISCHSKKFSGSTARTNKFYNIFTEDFCLYTFNYPKHTVLVNRKGTRYGRDEMDETVLPRYTEYLGFDNGEVVFDYNQKNKKNILILGNSYDNAYAKLLATHFNKTYVVDMRHYKDEVHEEFNYLEYIKKNKIDLVLLNGDDGYFVGKVYGFEVK